MNLKQTCEDSQVCFCKERAWRKMERIVIIGCPGSGKSTLARELGEKLDLPVVHLDQIYWSPGNWQHLEKDEFDALLMQELQKPRWILDGNFNRTLELRLERCDTVIFLDFNRIFYLYGRLFIVLRCNAPNFLD